jgi:Pyruvate/2-oxoacid:ferredoxin oxidoreductase delta subunit
MLHPIVNWDICEACNPCHAMAVCRTRAVLKFDPEEPASIELSRCNACGLCVLACSCGAISMRVWSVSASSPDGCLPFR